MSRTTIFDSVFRTRTAKQRFIYWQTVPLRRLTFLLLGIFCLFGMIAFVVDLLSLGQKPLFPVLVWTLFTGAMAVTYLLVLTRQPRYFLIALAMHIAGSFMLQHLIHLVAPPLSHPSIESGTRVAGVTILGLSLKSTVVRCRATRLEAILWTSSPSAMAQSSPM